MILITFTEKPCGFLRVLGTLVPVMSLSETSFGLGLRTTSPMVDEAACGPAHLLRQAVCITAAVAPRVHGYFLKVLVLWWVRLPHLAHHRQTVKNVQ